MFRSAPPLAASLFLTLWGGQALAVCPDGWPQTSTEFARADRVIVGWVSAARTIIDPEDPYAVVATEFVVETLQAYKGEPRETFTVYNSNDSGRFDMEFQHSYLLFLHQRGGRWSVDNCGNSFDLEWTDATFSPRRPYWTFMEVMAFKPQANAAMQGEAAAREALMRRSEPAAMPAPPRSSSPDWRIWSGAALVLIIFIMAALIRRRRAA